MELKEFLQQIADLAPGRAWVVGGALRDRLAGRMPQDFDLVIAEPTGALLNLTFWLERGVHGFWLDQQRQMVRLSVAGRTVDLASLQTDDLSGDLARRDFTVNAMALPLASWLSADQLGLVDPYQGRSDLAARHLRLVQSDALREDPVRVFRAARLMVDLALQPNEQALSALAAAAPNVALPPAERVWVELAKLLRHEHAPTALLRLEEWGAVAALFPEVMAMSRVGQNQHHQFTVDVHSERAFAAYAEVIHRGNYLLDSVRPFAKRYWQELQPTEQSAVMLAAWLHDIGKPGTRVVRDGKVTFYEHEHVGAKMAVQVAERLKLSREQSRLVHTFITFHMYPMQLWRTGHLDERLIHRLYRRTGELGVAIVLFTLADHLAKGEQVATSAEFRDHQQVVEQLLLAYFCRHDQVVAPKPWISGDEIVQAVGKARGPWVGEWKAALLEAQAAGHVNDRQQALQFVREYAPKRKRR